MIDTARFQRVAELFEAARALEGEARDGFLHQACADDPELLAEVRRLLGHHDTPSTVLDTPIVSEDVRLEMFAPLSAPPMPERIGRYEIKQQLGIGGMGVVYLAEQEHPHREVAVKVIRPGIVGRGLIRRFEIETAALGRLQHPGIAQIYEAGTFDDGTGPRPFFAMELVEGEPLTTYAERHDLDTRERLALFARVCDAVHHAHQRGVIHRDLKPGNILVTADGQPKVLDFGVARATDSDLQVTTLQTDAGQLVGTLPYMSPEQVGGKDSEVDVRSDVYALGVTLYELLAARLPYDFTDATILTAARIVTDAQPVPLSTISRLWRGDLNTIVLKALEKEPSRRYQSASDLSADIRRMLASEPIIARPATAAYQLRKFARRHVAFTAGLSVAMFCFVFGSAVVVWQASRVQAEAETRREVAAFLREMLTSVDPEKSGGRPPSVVDMLDDAAARLDERFENAPLVAADLAYTIGNTYHALGLYDKAEAELHAAADIYRERFGLRDDRTLRAIAEHAFALHELDRLEEADAMLAEVMPFARDGKGVGAMSVLVKQAIVADDLGREDEAGELYHEIYQVNLARLGENANDTINAKLNIGSFYIEHKRYDEALPYCESTVAAFRKKLGDDHPYTLTAIANLGACYTNLGRVEEGAPLLKEAAERSARVLGPTHLHSLRRAKNLALAQWHLGDYDAWKQTSDKLLDDCEQTLGISHSQTIAALEVYVAAIGMGGDMEGAERLALDWYERLCASVGETHRSTGRAAMLLMNIYDEWGREEEEARWQAIADRTDYRP